MPGPSSATRLENATVKACPSGAMFTVKEPAGHPDPALVKDLSLTLGFEVVVGVAVAVGVAVGVGVGVGVGVLAVAVLRVGAGVGVGVGVCVGFEPLSLHTPFQS